jgi:hypothetical protein
MEKFNYIHFEIYCLQCKSGIQKNEYQIKLDNFYLCSRCVKTISEVQSTTEGEASRELPRGTIKLDCKGSLQIFLKSNLIRKSGKFWLIHERVLSLYYDNGRTTKRFDLTWIWGYYSNRYNSQRKNLK